MENKQDGITIFDTLFTNNHICMMKLLLPLLPPSTQKTFAIYIKYMELQYTLQYFNRHPHGLLLTPQTNSGTYDFNTVCDSLLPYCTPREKEGFTQMRNMMNTFRNLQDMMEMVNTMKELFPEGFESMENGGFGGLGNLSPEMIANMSNIFGNGSMGDIFNNFSL